MFSNPLCLGFSMVMGRFTFVMIYFLWSVNVNVFCHILYLQHGEWYAAKLLIVTSPHLVNYSLVYILLIFLDDGTCDIAVWTTALETI